MIAIIAALYFTRRREYVVSSGAYFTLSTKAVFNYAFMIFSYNISSTAENRA